MLQIFAKSTLIAIFINNFLVIYSTEIKMIKYFQTFLGVLLISNFRHVYMLYVFFWVIPRRLNFICRRFGTLCLLHLHRQVGVHLPAYEDGTECSETSAYKIQTPGNYQEENIQHSLGWLIGPLLRDDSFKQLNNLRISWTILCSRSRHSLFNP